MTKKATYIRVSTLEQNTARQEVKTIGEVFKDKVSGAVPFEEREQGAKLLKLIESGKITELHIKSIDRLGRKQINILQIVERIQKANCQLCITDLGTNLFLDNGKVNSTFNLFVSILSGLAEQEREIIRERQAEGIEIAKRNGAYKNRITRNKETTKAFLGKHPGIINCLNAGMSIRKTATTCKVSSATVLKVKKALNQDPKQKTLEQGVREAIQNSLTHE